MSNPCVDIIIPTFNRENTIQRAVESALSQTHTNLRLTIVDDGSTDATLEKLRLTTDPRMRVVRLAWNSGVTAAKNAGLDELSADSAYFGILDSDDELHPEAVQVLVAAHQTGTYSQVFGLCHDMHTGESTSLLDGEPCTRPVLLGLGDALAGRMSGEYWQLVRSDMLGPFRFDPRASGGEAVLWHQLLARAPGLVVPRHVRSYDRSLDDRVSVGQYSRSRARGKMWAYRVYADTFGADLSVERLSQLRAESLKYALLAKDFSYARVQVFNPRIPKRTRLKSCLWPLYAMLKHTYAAFQTQRTSAGR